MKSMGAIVFCLTVAPSLAADIGTAFTYQGRLVKNGTPVTSAPPHCDFTIRLWDAATSGNEKGNSPQSLSGIAVVGGLFTAQVDFGPGAIDGTARWLEIEVFCPGDAGLAVLSPRVELAPAPHALALRNFRVEPAGPDADGYRGPNVVGGYSSNSVSPGVVGATVFGGGVRVVGQPNYVQGDFAAVGGGYFNRASSEASTVAGGGDNWAVQSATTVSGGLSNTADNAYSTVGGGWQNHAGGDFSTIGGGWINNASGGASTISGGVDNTAGNAYSTISGGFSNTASHGHTTVGGGNNNTASGNYASVGGGDDNVASGESSSVPGGFSNEAGGSFSFAAGNRANIRNSTQSADSNGDEGTFVWADSTSEDFTSTGPNQFLVRSTGGMRLATGDGSAPQFQAILPSTDTPTTLAINPLGGVVSIGTSAPDPAYQFYVNGGAGFAVPGGGVVGVGTPGGVPGLTALAENGHRRDIRFRDTTLSLLTSADGTTPSLTNGVVIDESGRTGAGRAPTANRFEVEGEASKTTAGSFASNSDRAIKANIRGIANALETILKLRPVAFRYTDEYKSKHRSIKDQDYYNYIAQEFREVFPEWVRDSGEDGLLQVDSYPASVYSVAAIQELHNVVMEKDCEIPTLRDEVAELKAMMSTLIEKTGDSQ